ncbi:MAG: hypothetical protein AAFQ11_07445, partial [Pseudomonadota bacterium]
RHACPTQAELMDRLEDLCVADADALMSGCDVVVVSHATDAFRAAVASRNPRVRILDLARLFKTVPGEASYAGIAW